MTTPKYLFYCSVLALGACHTPPTSPALSADTAAVGEPKVEATPSAPVLAAPKYCNPAFGDAISASISSPVDELLAYQRALRQLAPAELNKAIADLALQPKNVRTTMQKAMLLAALRGNSDLLRAQNLLDQLLKSTEPDAERLKPLASLLYVYYGEWRRLADSVEKLNQQVRDGQRRVEQLNEKLEALKNIERTLPALPGANASTSAVTPALNAGAGNQ